MRITWFGHSCFRIDTDKSSILIDPFLTGNAAFEDTGLTVHEATRGVTHVALTHGHDDHTGDALAICKQTGAQLLAVFPDLFLPAKKMEFYPHEFFGEL